MTAPTEKAAPIPADVLALAKSASAGIELYAGRKRSVEAIARAIMQDRADREARPSLPDSREERIRAEAAEDERDRIYERVLRHAAGRMPDAARAAAWLGREEDAMPPADRARSRQGGNNG